MNEFLGRLIVSLKYIRFIKNIQLRNYTRSVTGDRVLELGQETLTGRLLNYLESSKTKNSSEGTDRSPHTTILKWKGEQDLGRCNMDQILSALNSISNRKLYRNRTEFFALLNSIDLELCRRAHELQTSEIINVLHAFMKIIPHRIIEYKFYEIALETIFNLSGTLSKNDLIQLIFYIGLQKKTSRSQFMLRKCMKLLNKELVNNLSSEELCVICNSTFKTSTKIDNKLILNKVTGYLNDNLCLLKDSAIFATLIKTIRHNRYQSEDLLATISCTIFFNKTVNCYSFAALCHILALFSDYLYYDENLLNLFTKKCIQLLKSSDYTSEHTYLQEQPRAKDIHRFLWCLSNLNYKNIDKEDIKSVIVPNIIKRMQSGEFEDDFTILIEMALYLWMLEYRDPELVRHALTKENAQYIRGFANPTKQRLDLLVTCIYYEDRSFYKNLNIQVKTNTDYNMGPQLQKRQLLNRVYETLKLIPAKFEVNKYTLGCQVPNINIIGITGYKRKIYKAVHIEVLDDYTCMKNTDGVPSGLMQLKLRLMEGFDEGIILIRADEIESMSDQELSNFLEDELDLVC